MTNQVCYINRQSGEVIYQGQHISIRPKTFELLLLLTDNPKQIFNKTELLENLWPDTIVEEQVVFQSINEIRKAFDNNDVIKTFPKRGYQWQLPVAFDESYAIGTDPVSSTEKKKPTKSLLITLTVAVSLSLVLLLFNLVEIEIKNGNQTSTSIVNINHDGLLFLPTDVESLTQSQQWLRFGILDSVISQYAPTPSLTVFKLEDTIEIINRVPSPKVDMIDTLFAKSGASYIVETSVSGVPGEYHLIYTMHTQKGRMKEVLTLTTLDDITENITHLTQDKLGGNHKKNEQTFEQTLQNELMASGIELLEAGDATSALSFFHSAMLKQPNNLLALYFLSRVQMEAGRYTEALETVNKAINLADSDYPSLNRIRLIRGNALLATGKLQQGKSELELAESLSKQVADWLYYAYSQTILAKVAQFEEDFPQAEIRLNRALEYQQILNCPMGIAQSELDFADYYLLRHNTTKAKEKFDKARAIVSNKSLSKLEPQITAFKNRLASE